MTLYLKRFFALSLETLFFFKVFKNVLFWGEREKKTVVVCALLEHEIIMMIPAVAELVVEFQLGL